MYITKFVFQFLVTLFRICCGKPLQLSGNPVSIPAKPSLVTAKAQGCSKTQPEPPGPLLTLFFQLLEAICYFSCFLLLSLK